MARRNSLEVLVHVKAKETETLVTLTDYDGDGRPMPRNLKTAAVQWPNFEDADVRILAVNPSDPREALWHLRFPSAQPELFLRFPVVDISEIKKLFLAWTGTELPEELGTLPAVRVS